MLYETVRIEKKVTSLVKKASLLISYDKEIGSYKLAILVFTQTGFANFDWVTFIKLV